MVAAAAKAADGPLPWKRVCALCLCDIAHFYTVCSIFSYAGIMSADLGWAADRDSAGFIAGFLQSSNTLGRIPTAMLWGVVAERWGHKQALICTLASIAVGGISFGLCTNFFAAVIVRGLLLGALNGWRTLLGPVCYEAAGASRQTEVLGMVSAAGSFTQLFGPALGGWTYNLTPGPPALLSSAIGATVGSVALYACWLWIPATGDQQGPKDKGSSKDESFSTLLRSRPVPLIIGLRCLHGCLIFMLFEVAPLWAISARNLGGLELSEDRLGSLLSFSAVGNMLFTARVMPFITKRVGLRRSYMLGGMLSAIGCVVMPFTQGQISMVVVHMWTLSAASMIGAAGIACTNNAVPQKHRAKVTGFAVTFESCSKGLAPMLGASAFAWSITSLGFAGHGFVFIAMACAYVALCFGAASLPLSVEHQVVALDTGARAPDAPDVELESSRSPVTIAPDGNELQEGSAEPCQPLTTPRVHYQRLE